MKTRIAGTVLNIAGPEEMTAATEGLFRKQVGAALNGHSVIEVDLSRTKAMDCAGLGALIAVSNLAQRRTGGLRVIGASRVVQRLFDAVRAENLFEIVSVTTPGSPSLVRALPVPPPAVPAWSASH